MPRKNTNLLVRYLQEKAGKEYLREKETTAIIKQAVIQALKGGVNHPTKYKGFQITSSNMKRPRLDKIATLGRGSKDVLIVNILKARKHQEKETATMIKQAVIQT